MKILQVAKGRKKTSVVVLMVAMIILSNVSFGAKASNYATYDSDGIIDEQAYVEDEVMVASLENHSTIQENDMGWSLDPDYNYAPSSTGYASGANSPPEVTYKNSNEDHNNEAYYEEDRSSYEKIEDEYRYEDDYGTVDDGYKEDTVTHEFFTTIMPLSIITSSGTVANGDTATVGADITGDIIVDGGTLILDGSHTINGTVTVQDGGTFNMSNGEITGSDRGVVVTGAASTFNLSGNGIIRENISLGSGGGVRANTGATINMSGGSIEENQGDNGGGVAIEDTNTTFNMSGGSIRENSAANNGGGVSAAATATFIMTGGVIEDNNAANLGGGVSTGTGASFHMSQPSSVETLIYNNRASNSGGVQVGMAGTTFVMTGGKIEYNHALAGNGGGARIAGNASFTMSGGTIEDNTATQNGGGVAIESGASFTMNEGANGSSGTISSNGATWGGGVLVDSSTFDLHGGVIHGNTANSGGGGVRVQHSSVFTLYDGTVSSNTANSHGGGISIHDTSTVYMHDGEIINNSCNQSGGGVVIGASADAIFINRFYLYNGNISGNQAATYGGGGVNVSTNAFFAMFNGTINNNQAINNTNGGGVWIGNNAITTMDGGTIQANTGINGGGVWVATTGTFNATSGGIINNHANQHGGAIWTTRYHNIEIANTVIFNHNTAIIPYNHGIANQGMSGNIDPAYSGGGLGGDPQNIGWASVSIPDTHALNNFDINYTGTPLLLNVTVVNSHATVTGEGEYSYNDSVTIHAGTREGYTFTGWTVDGTDIMLAGSTDATTTFTMPLRNVTVTANWYMPGNNGGDSVGNGNNNGGDSVGNGNNNGSGSIGGGGNNSGSGNIAGGGIGSGGNSSSNTPLPGFITPHDNIERESGSPDNPIVAPPDNPAPDDGGVNQPVNENNEIPNLPQSPSTENEENMTLNATSVDANTEIERKNPRTSDDSSSNKTSLLITGIVISLGALLLESKLRKGTAS